MSKPSTHPQDMSKKEKSLDISWEPTLPFNTLPLLPPTTELETKAILKQCIESRSALAELKQAAENLPNQTLLINVVPILEAQSSSEIENIVTTSDKLFRSSLLEQTPDPATKEAIHYRNALKAGCKEIKRKPISRRTAELVCSEIKDQPMKIRSGSGTHLTDEPTGEIIYTPPAGSDVLNEKLSNWETFINNSVNLDPLIVMSVAHYQFEAIHPFTDGNGRTGRILNLLYLVQTGLLHSPILYQSRYILKNKTDYYLNLRAVTRFQEWENWLLFMLKGVEDAAKWTLLKIQKIQILIQETRNKLQEKLPKIYSGELLEILFTQPYCRIANLVDSGICKRQTASSYLKELIRIGILKEEKVGREKIFLHQAFLKLLQESEP